MTALPHQIPRYTIAEYLRMEYDSSERHEYYNGQIIAVAGGSPQHSRIISNLIREIGVRLKGGPCQVYDSNLRVRVPNADLYVYPDATVICGPIEHDADDAKRQTITNPKLVVEVLSPSTDNIDYGLKLQHYLDCETVEEYVLVTQDSPHVQTYFRQPGGSWLFTPVMDRAASTRLRCQGIEIPLSEIYAGVEFSASSPEKSKK